MILVAVHSLLLTLHFGSSSPCIHSENQVQNISYSNHYAVNNCIKHRHAVLVALLYLDKVNNTKGIMLVVSSGTNFESAVFKRRWELMIHDKEISTVEDY